MSKRMTVEEAFNLANQEGAPYYMVLLYATVLAQHDWYYAYSDDHGVWQRGERQRSVIQQMEQAIDKHGKQWSKMARDFFNDLAPWVAAPESLDKEEGRIAAERRSRFAHMTALAQPVIIDIVVSFKPKVDAA